MLRSSWHIARTLLAAAVVLAVPAYAVCSLMPGAAPRTGQVALADSDDPIRNGLRIITQSSARAEQSVPQIDRGPQVELLTQWTFTDKGKPSPYH
jgi:hypothetical protein